MKLSNLCIAFGLLTALAAAHESSGEPVTSEDQLTRPAYIDELFRRVSHTEPSDLLSREGQVHMQTLPAVGREDRHAEVEGRWIAAGQCNPVGDEEGDVIGAIVSQAANTRIVIINEAHDRPHHREFTRGLATRLAPLGYTHFAAEAFNPDTLENNKRLPFARVMLWPGESIPLLLPAGSYLLAGFREDSHDLKLIEIHVNSEER